jgi:TIR domain
MTTFISYSRKDSEFALKLAKELQTAGADIWIDRLNIPHGSHWDREVQGALESCGRVIIILSPNAVESRTVMDEVNFALKNKKQVVPVLHLDCKIPFRLDTIQHLDFRVESQNSLGELLNLLGVKPPPPPVDPPLPVEGGLMITDVHGNKTTLTNPHIAYPGGWGPSTDEKGIQIRRGVERATMEWSRVRSIAFKSRKDKNEKGTEIWQYDIVITLRTGKQLNAEIVDDWNMAYMGGGGTGLLYGETDLGETRIRFCDIENIQVIDPSERGPAV